MRFGLNEEQRLLANEFAKWAKTNDLESLRSYANIAPEQRINEDKRKQQQFCEVGGSGLTIAMEHGGSGLGILEAGLISYEVGLSCFPVSTVSAIVAAHCLADKPAMLASIASGEKWFALADASSKMTHSLKWEANKLSAAEVFVNDPFTASDLILLDQGIVWHIDLASQQDKVARQELRTIDNTRSIGSLKLDNVEATQLKAQEATVRQIIAIILASESLGAAQSCLDQAVAWSLEREQFGQVIGSFQAVKHLCAEMATEIEPAKSLMWYAAYALDTKQLDAGYCAHLLQAHCSDLAHQVARTATEVHGGMGFTDLCGLHFWFKRIGLNRQWFGNATMHRKLAAQLQGLI